ncbi:hypothetical protein Ngar_c33730 [Candidatus Nitrososphaera gargensis Ga9.2]|uniref:Uncharacterized protein n=2 Tax=Candidatus Nitrososphaera gargensis TaxID=497727 RepID=K0ILA9_NITGG|nr:hypothetical protein Ngar_c33730 [Candidatus Nitrososphaera gargensis Ga9.2]
MLIALKAILYLMKSEPGMSRKEADDLLSLMGDDEEMRSRLAEVLKSELAGSSRRARAVRDVGRLRR